MLMKTEVFQSGCVAGESKMGANFLTSFCFTNSASLNDGAEITELAAAEVPVEVDRALLFFGRRGDEFDGLSFAEDLRLNLLGDMIFLQFRIAIAQSLYSFRQPRTLGMFSPHQRNWRQDIDDNVGGASLPNKCSAVLRDASSEMGMLFPVTGWSRHQPVQ
jgi:hypothetical protein